ncbi:MAG: DUF1800 domain-containing protein [Chloroflexota bacterium]
MALSRRDFLRLGSITAVSATAAACSTVGHELNRQSFPEEIVPQESVTGSTDTALRMLNRAGYGPRPGELNRVRQMGLSSYLEEQLNPQAIDDTAVDLMIRGLSVYHMDPNQLVEVEEQDALFDLIGGTFLRAVHSKRQLYEAMVEFWSDHFNIYVRKVQFMPMLKILDDREAIRPYALTSFRDLLYASAKSPAMLYYLDNVHNEKSAPNENYARELLELHTMGVNSGYTQKDVQEAARVLTGWTVGKRGRDTGVTIFEPDLHDAGEKIVLGQQFPAGQGEEELSQLLELLLTHPATANFIAMKLVRRFVADEPPESLINRVAQTFTETDGDIKAMLRVIFLSQEFATAPPKLKRPFTYMVSVARALQINIRLGRGRELGQWFQRLGQVPFHWPPPNGYPDVSVAWASNLLPRWNLALVILHNEMANSSVPLEKLNNAAPIETSVQLLTIFSELMYGRSLTPDEESLFNAYLGDDTAFDLNNPKLKDAAALMLASPSFQWT